MSSFGRFLTIGLFLSLIPVRVLAANPSEFSPAVNYGIGLMPFSVTVGDFNGDGVPDVAEANFCGDLGCSSSGSVSVLLGNGDGTFQTAVNYDGGLFPIAVSTGDFDADGKLDLAVANDGYPSGTVSVLLGVGNGAFAAPIPYAVGPAYPFSVAVADLNGDGRLDLAVVTGTDNQAPGSVAVLMGNGDGTFQPPAIYGVGAGPTSLAVGDLNGDHMPDIVVTDAAGGVGAGNVSVLLNNGDGTLQPALTFPAGQTPVAVAVGDLNGDGKADLGVANYTALSTVSVLLGNGEGAFALPTSYPATGVAYSVVEADFNGDGALDMATGNFDVANPGISVFLGVGDGTLYPATNYPMASFSAVSALATADFNLDNQADLAAANEVGLTSNMSILLNSGSFAGAELSKARIGFGSQKVGTSSPPQKVTLTNNGFLTLTLSHITVTGDFLETTTCGHSVKIAANCSVMIEFHPKTTGLRTGTVTITDNAKRHQQVIQLKGTGTP
jgi:hypothetical protein